MAGAGVDGTFMESARFLDVTSCGPDKSRKDAG
jgi:hypothetical protein